MELTAIAKHKILKRSFKVLEIDFKKQMVKCKGKVDKGVCHYCSVTVECQEPWFRLGDVDLEIKVNGKECKT